MFGLFRSKKPAEAALPVDGTPLAKPEGAAQLDAQAEGLRPAPPAPTATSGSSSSSSSGGGAAAPAGYGSGPLEASLPPPSGASAMPVAAADIVLQELPRLLDAPPARASELLLQKLELASVTGLNWSSASADKQAKDVKLRTLSELVDFMGSPVNQKLITEAMYEPCMAMVSANIFRSLPMPKLSVEEATGAAGGSGGGGDGGDDSEPPLEPAWNHLHLVYEFLLRFILSGEVKTKPAKKWVDATFCAKLVDLFESDDPREREYLKVSGGAAPPWCFLPLPASHPLNPPPHTHPTPLGRQSCTASMASS